MKAVSLRLDCPKCASGNIAYSCDPDCCLNHVCGDCLASFEPATRDTGTRCPEAAFPDQERDVCEPTVRCCVCGGLNVFRLESADGRNGKLICRECRALLDLTIES